MNLLTLPNDLLEKLEYDKIVDLVAQNCMGEAGAEAAYSMPFLTDRTAIIALLKEVQEMKSTLDQRNPFPMRRYVDTTEAAKMVGIEDYVLSLEELKNVQTVMVAQYAIAQFFKSRSTTYPHLFAIVQHFEFDEVLYAQLRKILDEEGNVRPDASPELMRIRRMIQSKRKELDARFRGVANNYSSKGYLADNIETFRNGRRVLAVLAEYKRALRGIIHDESSTGKTVFIEPEEVIDINNDIIDFEAEEQREIWRILRDLCRVLCPKADLLAQYQVSLTRLDLIYAKALVALRIKAIMPEIRETPQIEWRKAVHPILYLHHEKLKKPTVPFTLTFQGANRILMLSGPNAGGKSVSMKSVGLLQLMVQSGLLVPCADGSAVGIFTKIFADIGDQQSLEDDLSTYSSRLKLTKQMMDDADENTLILIDEMGSGTDPKMGGSIAVVAMRELNNRGVWGVVTTHYSDLKLFAYKTKGLLNGCMLFDKDNLSPTYEMKVGRPGSSYAFEMAIKNGWSDDLLAQARNRTGESESTVDQLLVDLQREKQELSEQLASVTEREKKLDSLIKNYENVYRDLEFMRKRAKLTAKEKAMQETAQTNKELEKLVRQLQEEKNLERAKELAQEAREKREALAKEAQALNEEIYYSSEVQKTAVKEISTGDYVRMRNSGAIGVVESIKKAEAVVVMGAMTMTIKLRDLEKVDAPLRQQKAGVSRDTIQSQAKFVPQIDLRGMRRDEALQALEEFVDEALMTSISELRVLHGKGDGILRNAVRTKLREYRSIERIYHPEHNDGGDGVTIVAF